MSESSILLTGLSVPLNGNVYTTAVIVCTLDGLTIPLVGLSVMF